jgi:hypothetical protein
MIMTCTYLNSHLLEAPREYVLHGLDPGLDWVSFWSPSLNVFLVCYGPSSILLVVLMDRVSHPTPSLLLGRLLTNIQVKNITLLHDTHGHTYIHHIGIIILLPYYTSFTLLGSPAGLDPSCLTQLCLFLSRSLDFLELFPNSLLIIFERH